MIIGCHLSFAEGFASMARAAHSTGGDTLQFFSRNPQGGAQKQWKQEDISEYIALGAEYGIQSPLCHAPYTLNPCSDKPNVRHFSRETMKSDLEALECIPGVMYNFHPGSHVGQGEAYGIVQIIKCINESAGQGTVPLLLETMAGKGSELGCTFEQLRLIIYGVHPEISDRIGVCLDTCHVYDAGYDIKNNLNGVLSEFDRIVGLERLKAIHLNDSKNAYASHKDRHEQIGEGSLGIETFRAVVNHPSLKDLPFYLETPNDLEGYAAEIKLLRSLRQD